MAQDDRAAGGAGAVLATMRHAAEQTGLLRAARTLRQLNQPSGFDCPGCAWPEPADRSAMEFCENGAKAVFHEATTRRLDAVFFREWTLSRLATQSDHWLEQQGRLTEPMHKPPGADRYQPIGWDDAFQRIAAHLNALPSPDAAVFYTSGRTSNEAAFLWQLFARQFGTNNLPDCSNMCHESSGTGLTEAIGVGKGTVGLEDFDHADLILIIGQNPGTNHPRMLTTLQQAKRRGCTVVSVNPLRERALVSFAHPKEVGGLLGHGTPISDLFLQVRIGGDIALLKGIAKAVLAAEEISPGRVLDWAFIRAHSDGFAAYREAMARVAWDDLVAESGIARADMQRAADLFLRAERVIACWAMGLTQHKHGVGNVQEVTNLLLLRGHVGRPGAGLCPVRGHSNVQGDRTMGIWEKPGAAFLERLGGEFGFTPPSRHGFDTVSAIAAMERGEAQVFVGMGGNFAAAAPDSVRTAAALGRCRLTVHVSTKLNRSHVVTGDEALILPCLGRTEVDVQTGGAQFVTVEDSMSVVHRSQGHLAPAAPTLRSEPTIVAGIADAVLGERSTVRWVDLVADYDRIRDRIARVIPGFEDFNTRVRTDDGFVLPRGGRDRRFATASGRAGFTVVALPRTKPAAGELLLMTVRSHDQFNTTIYGLDDRYRGIAGERRVVFLHADDVAAAGFAADQRVDLVSEVAGTTRRVQGFRIVPFDIPRGCAAAYFPEANPLVALESVADKSGTPTYKAIPIRLAPNTAPP